MTTIEIIIAYLAGEAAALPAHTNTETERLLKMAAQKIKEGMLPAASSGDEGKVLTVDNTGAPAWENISETKNPTT